MGKSKSLWLRVRAWLEADREVITTAASVVQAIVVVLGVLFALDQLADREGAEQREKIARTWGLYAGSIQLHLRFARADAAYQQATATGVSENEVRELQEKLKEDGVKVFGFYSQLMGCGSGNICDPDTVNELFCPFAMPQARRLLDLFYSYDEFLDQYIELGGQTQPAIFEFVVRCNHKEPSWIEEQTALEEYLTWVRELEP